MIAFLFFYLKVKSVALQCWVAIKFAKKGQIKFGVFRDGGTSRFAQTPWKRRKDDFFKHPLFKGIPRKNIARITASYILKINLFNQESNHEKQKNELKNTEFHFFTNVFSLST